MNNKKRVSQDSAIYWMRVVVVGIIFGFGLQFAQAWVNPSATPPNGNVAGPITTSIVNQIKQGGLSVASLFIVGKGASSSTIATDGPTTLVTKDYVDAKTGGGSGVIDMRRGSGCSQCPYGSQYNNGNGYCSFKIKSGALINVAGNATEGMTLLTWCEMNDHSPRVFDFWSY